MTQISQIFSNLIYFYCIYLFQMSQIQAEQSQKLLQRFQQQMEEEMLMRQQMMSNQLQMMTRIQNEFPAFDSNALEFPGLNKMSPKDIDNELQEAMKEKIKDIESIFKTKEEKLIENYEQVIKDLENKLDIEQGRFRDAADSYKEEKEKLVNNHRAVIERMNEEQKFIHESMKSEYLVVIDNLKSLRKLEIESKDDILTSANKISKIGETLDTQSKLIEKERKFIDTDKVNNLKRKEEELKIKETELLKLQDTIMHRQETSDNERMKLSEAIIKLEGKLHAKEMELESEKRKSIYDREQIDLKKKLFEDEKETFMENLRMEKNKIHEDRDNGYREIDKIKKDLVHQIKKVRAEKAKYTIYQRLHKTSGDEVDYQNSKAADDVEQQIQVLEKEKNKLKAAKLRLKNEEKKISEGRQKLTKQKHDISHAIEKLYVVEKGIAEKFQELENLLETSKNLRADGMNGIEEYNNLNEGVNDFLQTVEDSLLDLLKQEQRIKSETLILHDERKKMNNTRQTLLCTACARPTIRKSISSRELGHIDQWDDVLFSRRKNVPVPAGWIDLHATQKSNSNLRNRSSGDGASLEALDSHVSALKRDAEHDKKYLRDEFEYLKTLQSVNVKTLAKYQ